MTAACSKSTFVWWHAPSTNAASSVSSQANTSPNIVTIEPHAVQKGSISMEHSRVHDTGNPPEQSGAPVLDSQHIRAISSNWSRSLIGHT